MKNPNPRTDSGAASRSSLPRNGPAACPACQSTVLVTTTKSPDADSYWRCTKCGEVWNDSRRRAPQFPARGWR